MELSSLHINCLLRRGCIKAKKENNFRGILTLAILGALLHIHQWVTNIAARNEVERISELHVRFSKCMSHNILYQY